MKTIIIFNFHPNSVPEMQGESKSEKVGACSLNSTLTRRFAPPSPSGRGIILKTFPLPLGEGGAKRRVRVEFRLHSKSVSAMTSKKEFPALHYP